MPPDDPPTKGPYYRFLPEAVFGNRIGDNITAFPFRRPFGTEVEEKMYRPYGCQIWKNWDYYAAICPLIFDILVDMVGARISFLKGIRVFSDIVTY